MPKSLLWIGILLILCSIVLVLFAMFMGTISYKLVDGTKFENFFYSFLGFIVIISILAFITGIILSLVYEIKLCISNI